MMVNKSSLTTSNIAKAYQLLYARAARDEEVINAVEKYSDWYAFLSDMFSRGEFVAIETKRRLDASPITSDVIILAFQLLLGRDPTPQGVERLLTKNKSQRQLIYAIRGGDEWLRNYEEYRERKSLPDDNVLAKKVRCFQAKSIPRSGYHFLEKMLARYFGSQLRYCEYYKQKDCCHSMPCTKPYARALKNNYFMQKSHDSRLLDPIAQDISYIIQYRGILTQLQSHFDYVVKVTPDKIEDSMASFRKFALEKLDYYTGFYNKWVLNRIANAYVLTYEELTSNTESVLHDIIEYILGSNDINSDRLSFALLQKRTKTNTFNSPVGIRKVRDFRYFNSAFYSDLEKTTQERCPGYDKVFKSFKDD